MSLTGLFLILFLVVHLLGNLQLLYNDDGRAFNRYAAFMSTNPLIKLISYTLYLFILLHAVQGWLLWRKNNTARGAERYAVKVTRATNTSAFAARNMGWLGTILFVFIAIHMYQFWLQMHLGNLPMVNYDGKEVKDLYFIVNKAYVNPGFVLFYVLSMVIVAMHLYHGFQSAFQTLGLNHRKYSPLIHWIGRLYAVLVPLAFALIPVVMYGKVNGWW